MFKKILEPQRAQWRFALHREKPILTKRIKRRCALEEKTNWLNLYLIVFSFTSHCAKNIGTTEGAEALRAAQRETNTHKEAKRRCALEK